MRVKLNPDKDIVKEVRKKVKDNDGYCPCSIVHDEDAKCMCKSFRDQVDRCEEGECHCGLYIATREVNADAPLVGRIVKIKADTKRYISCVTIPDFVKNAELYISRVNANGTIVVALSDSQVECDALRQDDVIITDRFRTYHDTGLSLEPETLLSDIDIRIMGVPSRMDNIKITQRRLHIPEENIVIDKNKDGCLKTAMKAWSKPTDKKFVMVLQDDIELCDNFAECLAQIVRKHPDKIISLFQFLITGNRNIKDLQSPYVSLGYSYASGQGIIMPSSWVQDCLSGWEESGIKGDDTNISAWALRTKHEIITTLPCIIQHIGEHSVFSPGRILGKSSYYKKSAYTINWDNDYIVPYTNIVH